MMVGLGSTALGSMEQSGYSEEGFTDINADVSCAAPLSPPVGNTVNSQYLLPVLRRLEDLKLISSSGRCPQG